jgi:ABC-2 type transport system permease protein
MSIEPRASTRKAPSQQAVLRSLFLTLFLRGHSARQLQTSKAPRSVAQKLAGTLLLNVAFGAFAGFLHGQSVFMLSAYLHGLSLMFLGMFVTSSAGEVLFNREEADILMHRPVDPRALLWAKVRVLVEVSLWLAGSLNLIGMIVGALSSKGGWWFVPVHAASTAMQALFCTGCVVLVYQVCLRWFGRERLEGLMTTAQVLLSLAAVLSGQLMPEAMRHLERTLSVTQTRWWTWIVPPAWFAGIDDALVGSRALESWLLAAIGCATTAAVVWFAFGKLAQSFEAGLQILNESTGRVKGARGQRRLDRMLDLPPLSWWVRDPRERESFLLAAAYIVRDRDTKLRLYPAIAPILILPVVFMAREFGNREGDGPGQGFGFTFSSAYVGLAPLIAVNLLQFSQHWHAAELFRLAPMPGPGPICHGARKAVMCLLAFPLVLCFTVCALLMQRDVSDLLLLLPGVIALPLVSIIPNMGGRSVPLSQPIEQAKAASRGLTLMGTTFATIGLSMVAMLARHFEMLVPFLIVELLVVVPLYYALHRSVTRAGWTAMD